jgi:hypothetical protein
MKEAFSKISSLLMALLVLLSTLSFSGGMHFCGDHLVDFSLFEAVEGCSMKAKPALASSSCETMKMDMDCCSDVEFVVEGQQDLKLSFDQLSLDQQVFVTSFIHSYIHLYKGTARDAMHYKDYVPPPLIRNVQILDQTFRI